MKERQEKIDIVHAENKKLHDCLMKKIEEIEELQKKINSLESKNIAIANENMKNRAILDSKCQEITELEAKLDNMKDRFETEVGCRIGFEEKCISMNK